MKHAPLLFLTSLVSIAQANQPEKQINTTQELDQLPDDALKHIGKFLDPQSTQNLSNTSRRFRAPIQESLLRKASEDGITFDLSVQGGNTPSKHTVDDVLSFLEQANKKGIKSIKLALIINNTYDDNPLDEILSACDNVTDFTITPVDDSLIQKITRSKLRDSLQKLTVINESHTGIISPIGVQDLAQLKHLTHLNLKNITLSRDVHVYDLVGGTVALKNQYTMIPPLKDIPFLQSFIYSPPSGTNADVRDIIKDLKNLTELDLSNVQMDDNLLQTISDLPLERLALTGVGTITDNGINNTLYSKLTQTLKTLNLSGNQITDQGFQTLISNYQLNQIFLDNNQISTIPDLSQYPQLTELSLSGNQINGQGLQGLLGSKVVRLTLNNNQITDANIRTITRLPELRILNIANNQLTDKSSRFIAQSPKIKKLNISRNPEIRLTGIEIIAKSHNRLQGLSIGGTGYGDLNYLKETYPFITEQDVNY